MKKILLRFGILIFVFSMFGTANAQTSTKTNTELIYKQKGSHISTAVIYFSDKNGNDNITPEEFVDYTDVYFTIKPAHSNERNYFKEKEIAEDLNSISLFQNGVNVSKSKALLPVNNDAGKTDRVIMSFPKRDVVLYEPFEFRSPFDTSAPVQLPDKYFKYYFEFRPIYVDGLNYSDDKDYISAYKTMMKIVDEAKTKEEVRHYSFWDSASQTIIETAIEQYTDSLSNLLEKLDADFASGFSKNDLEKQDSVYHLIKDAQQTFKPYMEMDFPKSREYVGLFAKLLDESQALIINNQKQFDMHEMFFLENSTYELYEFGFYIDLLARMLCRLDTLKILDGLKPVDISLLDKMPEKRQELINTGWMEKFKNILNVVNTNILEKSFVFGDSIMNNLQRQVPQEHQPYYEIFYAFNYLDDNESMFRNFMSEAVRKCTDEKLIGNLEMWMLSYDLTFNRIDKDIVSRINKGIRLINQTKWTEAENLFNILTKQANTVAVPWFYLGVIKTHNKEVFSAGEKFMLAMEKFPMYIAPRIYSFKLLYEEGDYEKLLKDVNEAIAVYNTWLFYFWKAKTLFALNRNKEVVKTIEENCNVLNPWSVEASFLLGDAYLNLKNFDKAEQAYRKTQIIDPYMKSGAFDEKMNHLLEAKKK